MTKRWLFGAIGVVAALCLSEISCFIYVSIREGQVFSWSDWDERRREIIIQHGDKSSPDESLDPGFPNDDVVIHPFLGYTRDPTRQSSINEHGFAGTASPIHHRSDSTVIVGLVGGDVAEQFYHDGMPALERRLRGATQFAEKEIVAVNLTNGGYKQPQQLMALMYMLALGAEFDFLINIDGFNEVSLHEAENAAQGVYPNYPSNWYMFTSNIPDPSLRRLIGHRQHLEAKMATLARSSGRSPLRYSTTWNTIWSFRHDSLVRRYSEVSHRVKTYKVMAKEQVPYWISGPRIQFSSDRSLYDHLASVWADCSIQLHRVCRENDIQYFHFLQPNQYVAGSKTVELTEKSVSHAENKPYIEGIVKGYPRLVDAAKRLHEHGVQFVNLTNAFASVQKSPYIDDRCSFGKEGQELMATQIANAILRGPTLEFDE